MNRRLLILGFGGHARSVADVAMRCGYETLLFVDENACEGETFLGFDVIKSLVSPLSSDWDAFPASGDNLRRSQQYESIAQLGLGIATLISPAATIGIGSQVESGCFIGHHAHVGSMAKIGRACIINTGAIVEHESQVGDYSHVSVNATIAGRSTLGAFSMLGAGACIIDGLSVVDHVILGAGAVVHRPIVDAGTYVGIPASRKP
jgi:sugar O-acyltransferase (sialic acid O-acetyltransferase NeuD family)